MNNNIKQDFDYFLCRKKEILVTPNFDIQNKESSVCNLLNCDEITKPYLVHFLEKMTNKVPKEYLNILYTNLLTLKIICRIEFDDWKNETHGRYISELNEIHLKKDFLNTIYHELLHVASTFYKKDNNFDYLNRYSGFSQVNFSNVIGMGLNEGYTQYLTNQLFENDTNIFKGYPYFTHIAKLLEIIVGKNEMMELYFNCNLKGLTDNLTKYNDYDTILNFINELDFLIIHLYDKHPSINAKKCITNSLIDVNTFLLSTYINKIENDYTIKNKNDLISKIQEFYNMIFDEIITSNGIKYKNLKSSKIFSIAINSLLKCYYEFSNNSNTIDFIDLSEKRTSIKNVKLKLNSKLKQSKFL